MKYFRRLTKIAGLVTLLLCIGLVANPVPANALSASDWRAGHIMDDNIFFNANTMNTGDIQNFIVSKEPSCRAGYTCLKDYSQNFGSVAADAYCGAIAGGTKSAANIIYDVSRACGINPQVLIVLLEKEQSLILDDWPTARQYQFATGFCVYDTVAPPSCAGTDGFFNQIYYAGRQFRRYIQQPNSFSFAVGRTSSVRYSPDGNCGASDVTMETQATAALYNYTPYQPNNAALANLYGAAPPCGAYGNRNFWRIFNDWFGPTTGDGYVLAMNQDDNSQWVLYRGIKQYVPSGEIKEAWGLPETPITMSGNYLSSFPEGPHLGRLFHRIGDPALYYADGGKKYYISSAAMKAAWGLNGQNESFVSSGLWDLPQNGGYLSYSVKTASNPALYMIDGLNDSGQMVLRQYSNPDVFHAWEGDNGGITTVSDTLFNNFDNAVGSSITNFTAKSASDPSQYQVVSGQKLYLSGAIAPLYNQSVTTVGQTTINRLVTSSAATQFMRANGSPQVYLVDSGQRHYVPSSAYIAAWGNAPVNLVTSANLSLIPEDTGSPLNSFMGNVSGQFYLLDGRSWTIPTALKTPYAGSSTPFVASASLIAAIPAGGTATNYLKGSGGAPVYLMDNGAKRHIMSARSYGLWSGGQQPTTVNDFVLSQFSNGSDIDSNYVTNGSINAAIDAGNYYSVAAGVATDWSLSGPASIDASTLSSLTSGGALSNKVRVGSSYYLVKYGRSHITFNTNLANIWGIDPGTSLNVSSTFINSVSADSPLTIFVRPTDSNDHRIFVADADNKLFTLSSVQQVQNYGYISGDMLALSASDINAMTVTSAQNILQQGSGSNYAVLDYGSKRSFSNGTVQSMWLDSGNQTSVSDYFWNFIPSYTTIGASVKGSAPNVYAIDTGQKRWILSQGTYQSYVTSYGPYSAISDKLSSVLPAGSNLP